MFTDIAGFTALVETMAPIGLAALLNDCFAGMTERVFAHAGTVTKVMGDGLHVLFGAPAAQEDHAARAVACALALDGFAEAFRAARHAEGVGLGATPIGLHAGPALVGDFGGGRHLDDAAYGDTIDTAARLEPLPAEQFAGPATRAYTGAYEKLAAGDPGALPAFAALVGTAGADPLASFHLRRLLNGGTGTVVDLR